jgi:hypothetical protein
MIGREALARIRFFGFESGQQKAKTIVATKKSFKIRSFLSGYSMWTCHHAGPSALSPSSTVAERN